MNGTVEQHGELHAHGSIRTTANGSMVEAVGSGIAVVLAILGLAGVMSMELMAVAVIAIGAALLFEGGAVGARFSRLLATNGGSVAGYNSVGTGMTAEFLAGAAGIVLGLLALLHVEPYILPPVALIVFGGALLLGSAATSRLCYLEATNGSTGDAVHDVAREAISAAAGAKILTGIAAAILGILSLVGTNPPVLTLTLVGLLCLGGAIAVEGTAISQRIHHLLG